MALQGKISSGDIAVGINALQELLQCQSDTIEKTIDKTITIQSYK